jgi:cobalamin biosynthesis Mg chelatase CobN
MSLAMSDPQNRRDGRARVPVRAHARLGVLAGVACLLALSPSAPALALTGAAAAHTSSVPSLPIPASARVHPGTSSSSTAAAPATPSTQAGSGGGTPTTTYVPSETTTPPAAGTTAGQGLTTPSGLAATPAKSTSPARARSKRSDERTTEAIVIAVLAALLALGCIAWGLARRRAFEPHWLLSLRHAIAEAGYRASATWSEFADWLRLGH